jgi:beta-glucosidase
LAPFASIFALTLVSIPFASPYARASKVPPGFEWGVATSAHQTEGVAGGGEAGDWWAFEHRAPSPIARGDTADLATDAWHRYDEDFALAQRLGVTSLRTSIAWEKVEPAPHVFSTEALAHYRAVFESLRARGIRPMIALHHFTHPSWFNERGGWTSSEAPALFLEYAARVVETLGDLCDLWITFNEPIVLVSMGYLKGEVPPERNSLAEAYEAAYQIARAHRMTTAMIHARQGVSRGYSPGLRGVGLANSWMIYDPWDASAPKDRQAAAVVADLNNWAFVKGAISDRLDFEIPAEVPGAFDFHREFPVDDVAPGADPRLDWIGANYYARYLIRYDPKGGVRAGWITPEGPRSDNGWSIYPTGMGRILDEAARRYPGIPLVVSENGLSDADDSRRAAYLADHLASLDQALASGRDVRGYYHWTLTDNFEWLSGYQYRFGLAEVRYEAGLRRAPRPSFEAYRREIAARQ